MIILDTNVLSALMREAPEAAVVGWLDRQRDAIRGAPRPGASAGGAPAARPRGRLRALAGRGLGKPRARFRQQRGERGGVARGGATARRPANRLARHTD